MKESYRPGYVSVKGGYCRVEPLVALYKAVFFDFPDLSVFVPGLQVGLQVRLVTIPAAMAPWILQISSSCSETEKEEGSEKNTESVVDVKQPLMTYTNDDVNGYFTQK